MDTWKNQLYFGDNLEILRGRHIPAGTVDLIYLDPPFNSNATCNVLFASRSQAPAWERPFAQSSSFGKISIAFNCMQLTPSPLRGEGWGGGGVIGAVYPKLQLWEAVGCVPRTIPLPPTFLFPSGR